MQNMLKNKHLVIIFDTIPRYCNEINQHLSMGHAEMIKIYDIITQLISTDKKESSRSNIINLKTIEVPFKSTNNSIITACEERLRNNCIDTSQKSIEDLLLYNWKTRFRKATGLLGTRFP
ncbi:MAG: hypothetical protein WBH77_08910 [Saccharofermentanales bacterium]